MVGKGGEGMGRDGMGALAAGQSSISAEFSFHFTSLSLEPRDIPLSTRAQCIARTREHHWGSPNPDHLLAAYSQTSLSHQRGISSRLMQESIRQNSKEQ